MGYLDSPYDLKCRWSEDMGEELNPTENYVRNYLLTHKSYLIHISSKMTAAWQANAMCWHGGDEERSSANCCFILSNLDENRETPISK